MASQSKKGVNLRDNQIQQNPYYLNPYDLNNVLPKGNDKVHFKDQLPDQSNKMNGSRRSTSKIKSQFNYSKSGNSNYTASIRHRIEKACTTNSTLDLQKQNVLLKRELEKLEREMLKKDQQIIEMRTKLMPSKEIQIEIVESYRALNYYQGKIKEMESQIYKFRETILKAPGDGVTVENLNVLFEDLRRDNEEYSGKIHQTEYEKSHLQDNYNRLKSKFYESQRQLAEYKRKEISPLHQYYLSSGVPLKAATNPKINMLFNQMISKNAPTEMEIKEKQLIKQDLQTQLGEISRKLNLVYEQNEKLRKQIDKLKVENEILQSELDEKSKHIKDLFIDFMSAKKSLKKIESQAHSERMLPRNSEISWSLSGKYRGMVEPLIHN